MGLNRRLERRLEVVLPLGRRPARPGRLHRRGLAQARGGRGCDAGSSDEPGSRGLGLAMCKGKGPTAGHPTSLRRTVAQGNETPMNSHEGPEDLLREWPEVCIKCNAS